MKRSSLLCTAAVLGLTATTTPAQTFPQARPLRIVVGFPPGGPADYTARVLAEKLPALLGGTVIVEIGRAHV